MKIIFTTMAAMVALAVAAPAATHPHEYPGQPAADRGIQSGELRMQLDAGVRSGAISRREMLPLRDSLRQLVRLEQRFSANGISGQEHAMLQQRGIALRRQIRLAERSGNGRSARVGDWDNDGRTADRGDWDRDGRTDRFVDARFDRPNSGDRFRGDVRIGQPVSHRMIALPAQYRADFRDTTEVYYRFDDKRVYRIDRRTNLVEAMLDLT